jgi:tRNA(fMet)-specific endonuclease VapC
VPYLLDTNILSDVITNPRGTAARRLAKEADASVLTSIIVAAELRFGAAKRGSRRLTDRVEGLLARIPIEPFAPPADEHHGNLRAALET